MLLQKEKIANLWVGAAPKIGHKMNDETIISFVFDKLQRSRWRTLLANPKKREWILNKLEHNPPLDEKNTTFAIHIYLH